MKIPFEIFKNNVLKKLGTKFNVMVSCPMHQNHSCLANSSNCLDGKDNNCHQYCEITVGIIPINIEVIFYGDDRKGFINSESLSIKNFVQRTKLDLVELLR